MRALLIIIFAVYVTTTASLDTISIQTLHKSARDDSDTVLAQLQSLDEPLEQCTEKTKGVFSFYDYSVILAMLAVSLKIGVFYGYFHKPSGGGTEDSTLGSKLGLFPVTLSLATSFVTAIELLGNPAEMFFYGTQFSLIGK